MKSFLKEHSEARAPNYTSMTEKRCSDLLQFFSHISLLVFLSYYIDFIKDFQGRESLFIWAFVVALVRRLTSAEFTFLFMVSNHYVL